MLHIELRGIRPAAGLVDQSRGRAGDQERFGYECRDKGFNATQGPRAQAARPQGLPICRHSEDVASAGQNQGHRLLVLQEGAVLYEGRPDGFREDVT